MMRVPKKKKAKKVKAFDYEKKHAWKKECKMAILLSFKRATIRFLFDR